jgi:hypothetical protein
LTLTPGSRLGPYEITAPVGAGGMGEVFRARDTKLGRDVAIKVLPAALAQDSERVSRFRREAQILATLNHANIAAIYGLEEADGTVGLVMELVAGDDLAQRLRGGAIPVEEAMAIAKQIAEALEEAHEKGIVHRDLKPANVKVTPEGKVKVLDFGLAKALEGDPASSGPNLSHSPTLSRHATEAGLVLGTAAYMSPEQARGKPVDKRADIWSFGVVLFEMLTGTQLFAGETVSDVLAAVLTRSPDWTALPASAPAGVRALLRRCIERDPRKRLHDAADARIALEDTDLEEGLGHDQGEASRATGLPRPGRPSIWASRMALVALGAAVGWAGTVLVGGTHAPDRAPASTVRYEIPLPPGHSFQGDLALSPDRRTLVFNAADDANGIRSLWRRPLDALESTKLEGTEDARFPFWSPDSRELGFFAGGELRALDSVSGAQRVVVKAGSYTEVRGASWSSAGVIVFNPRYSGGLRRVSDKGGVVEPASRLDVARGEGTHRLPNFLPDGRHFTFYASPGGGSEPGEVCLGELGSLEHRCLGISSSSGVPTRSGQLLFVRGKALLAQGLDPAAGKLVGDAIPLGPEFPSNVGTSGQRAFSAGGDALAFHLGAPSQNRLVWTDRAGVEQEAVYDRPGDWIFYPRLAPDGRRVALVVYRPNETGNIWVLDPARSGETPMTREGDNQAAVWSRSGRELAILTFAKDGESAVLRADSEKPQSARLWKAVPGLSNVDSWEAGDHGVLLSVIGADTGSDIWELSDSGEMRAVIATPATEHSGEASPDGRWLAYVSDIGGREDVYVAPISGQESPWKVSTDGGYDPRWRPDGRELFFIAPGGRLQAVATTLGSTFAAGAAQTLFSAHFDASANRAYDVAKDGRRFLVNLSKASPGSPIEVILGLGEEIRTRGARLATAR